LGILLVVSLIGNYLLSNGLRRHKETLNLKEDEWSKLGEQMHKLQIENASIAQELIHYEEAKRLIANYQEQIKKLSDEKSHLYARGEALMVKLQEQERYTHKHLAIIQENKEEIKNEFERLAFKVLENNSQKFAHLSREGILGVLTPLGKEIESFRNQVALTYEKESRDRILLQNEISLLKDLNIKISTDAINLTKALKGDNKQQGIWGEMVLEKVLETSGLRKGIEYEREVSYKDEENRLYRPDVIVKLPENRDLIIDSKSSLIAYEHYINTDDAAQKTLSLQRHIASLKKHIDGLSQKNYDRLRGTNSLDFVLMFIPIEGAFSLALEHDPPLYEYGFARKILIVTPTTLLIALRAVESLWRNERQHQNAKEIAKLAGSMVDKFVVLGDDILKISKQFETLQNNFLGVQNRLTTGKGNLVRQALRLKELGAQSTKTIASELVGEEGEKDET
jgi:DNA recombination protein RmuC